MNKNEHVAKEAYFEFILLWELKMKTSTTAVDPQHLKVKK